MLHPEYKSGTQSGSIAIQKTKITDHRIYYNCVQHGTIQPRPNDMVWWFRELDQQEKKLQNLLHFELTTRFFFL